MPFTTIALLSVIALVTQLSEPLSAQQQSEQSTLLLLKKQRSLYKIRYQDMNLIKLLLQLHSEMTERFIQV